MEKETKQNTPARAGSTLALNGKTYDADNGRHVDPVTRQIVPKIRHYGSFDIKPARSVHSGPARSETLKRAHVSKPVVERPLISRHVRTIAATPTHPMVSHFGRPADSLVNAAHTVRPSDVLSSLNGQEAGDRPVGLATQVQNYSPASSIRIPAKRQPLSKKEQVIRHQLAAAPTAKQKAAHHASHRTSKRLRITPPVIITAIILLGILASVVSYLSVPALSLFVAARSAGVEATYPNYVPDGFHFSGPVTYHDGEVTMKFKANGGPDTFTILQQKTFWDSGAVLDNYVLGRSQDYLTYSQGGITIYTFGSQAAWVNAGVLHAIDGNAHLTSAQILRIAGSM